jgi:hypothetical protein
MFRADPAPGPARFFIPPREVFFRRINPFSSAKAGTNDRHGNSRRVEHEDRHTRRRQLGHHAGGTPSRQAEPTVTLWSWSERDAENIRSTGRNTVYLPDLAIPHGAARHGSDLAEATAANGHASCSPPPRSSCAACSSAFPRRTSLADPLIVNVAKGIENRFAAAHVRGRGR